MMSAGSRDKLASQHSMPRLPRGSVRVLLAAALGPLAVAFLLRLLAVPLGCPGRFVYLWSPLWERRVIAVPSAVLMGVGLAVAVWLSGTGGPKGRRLGFVLAAAAVVALAVWSYVAPPQHINQHVFNTSSPSQDGAFVLEALRVRSVREYLAAFPQRAAAPPAAMRGTRVISNPPGTTLLAIGLWRTVERWPWLAHLPTARVRPEMAGEKTWEKVGPGVTLGLVFLWVLTALWAFSTVLWYATARLYCSPPAALACAVCCVFTPATLLLTPGKDPFQLLTTGVPLYFWLYAWRRNRPWAALVAGAAFPLACLVSLVHFWLAGIVVVATAWSALRRAGELRRTLLGVVLPAVVGALAVMAAVSVVGGLDWYGTFTSVARSQALVTRGPDAMPLAWQLLGVPLFLLFAGPALWALTFGSPRDGLEVPSLTEDEMHFGHGLLLASVVVMVATVGFTNSETPRLWIPFVPLLTLGLFLRRPLLRVGTRPAVAFLTALVWAQVASAAVQWSLMDMREAETRLLDGRFFS
jgi:hypothetical protein